MSLNNLNLLKTALEVIPKQSLKYLKYLGNKINDFGISVPEYSEPVEVRGSVQSIELSLYSQLGLDMAQNYRQIYVSEDIRGNEKQPQPDRFVFDNSTWEIVKNTPWFEYNGWCGALVLEIKELRE